MKILPAPTHLPAAGISELGEGPVWNPATGCLYWTDITQGRIHVLESPEGERTTFDLGGTASFVVPTPDPNVMVASCGASVVFLDMTSGETRPICTLEPAAGMRCNDAKCDPQGRLWVGTMPLKPGPMSGALYSLDRSGKPVTQLKGIGCSNGLAWNAASGTFFYIDTVKKRIERYRWDAATGDIEFERVLVEIPESDGLPDGMSIDNEGHLWVAFWGGSCVRRINGDTGDCIARIDLPVSLVTSCAFAGPDFDTLYITSANVGLDAETRAREPLAGGVFVTHPGVRGLAPDRYSV